MNKNRGEKLVKANTPAGIRDDSTTSGGPKGQQQKQPQEGRSVRRIEKRSDEPASFDDNYEATQEEAISNDNRRPEDENNY